MKTLLRTQLLAAALLTGSVAHAASSWQQFHGDAAHAGTNAQTINPDGIALRWKFAPTVGSVGVGTFLRASQPCVSVDGATVFVYGAKSPTSSNTGKIVAINAFDGSVKWSADVVAHNSFDSFSSPAYRHGFVYWAGSNGSGESRVYKFNAASGSTDASQGGWISVIPGRGEIINASPVMSDTKLFISVNVDFNQSAGRHVTLNLADGSVAWSNTDGGQCQGAAAYDAARNQIYQTVYQTSQYRVRAYNADTGAVVWTAPWNFSVSGFDAPSHCGIALAGNRIAVQDSRFSGNGTVYVADVAASGALIWSQPTPASGNGCPAIDAGGNVYTFSDFNGTGQCRGYGAASGSTLWTSAAGGGWQVSPGVASGYVFVGDQSANKMFLVNATTGAVVNTPQVGTPMPGSGPVAFGERTFFTVGFDGALYAYSTSSDFPVAATYTSGTGVSVGYDNKDRALGRPTTTTVGYKSPDFVTQLVFPLVPVYGAYQTTELVSVGRGGQLVLEFDHRVENDINNPFGADFIVFGNAFNFTKTGGFWENGDPSAITISPTTVNEPSQVSVSQDGVTWVPFSSGPFADDHAPTLGHIYEPANADAGLFTGNLWWGRKTDATLALNPTNTPSSFDGRTVAQVAQAYGASAGGTSFDLSGRGIEWFKFVKIEVPNLPSANIPEIDAVSDARVDADIRPPADVSGLVVTPSNKQAQLAWINPTDADFLGVIVVRKENAAVSGGPATTFGYRPGGALGGGTIIYTGKATSFTDTGLANAAAYHYKVFAFDEVLNYSGGVAALVNTLNLKPQITSPVSATATSVFIGQSITFTVAASDPDGDALTYTWDFADGTSASGTSVFHSWGFSGAFLVTVTVSDGKGGSVQSTITVNIGIDPSDVDSDGLPNSIDNDDDNDGFPDDMEIALGTSPVSAASTPLGGAKAGAGARADVFSKLQIKLNFAKADQDRITASGPLIVPAGFVKAGQQISIYVGGVGLTETLGKTGSAGRGKTKINVRGKRGGLAAQALAYTINMTGSFADKLADEGLTDDDVSNQPRTVVVAIIFNGTMYLQTETLQYTATKGKSGMAR